MTLLPTASGQETAVAARAAISPHRTPLIAALALLTVGTVAGLLTPRLLGHIVDLVVAAEPPGTVTIPAILLVVLALAQGGLVWAGSAVLARVGQTALAGIRERVLSRALTLPTQQIEQAGTGDLLARVSGDVEAVGEAVADILPNLLAAGLQITLTLVGLLVLDWRFALAALLAAPVQLIALRWYLRNAVPAYRTERIAEGVRAQRVLDAMDGAQTIRALRLGPAQLGRVAESSEQAKEISIFAAVLQSRFFGRLNGGELIGLGAILLVGFFLVRSGAATVGAASAAALYFHRLFDPFNSLLGLFDDAQYAGASFARLVGVAELPPPPEPETPAVPRDASIGLTDVRYHYHPGHDVVTGVNLDIEPGERVAVVGASGAGKTTLAKLIAGIQQPTGGQVRLGDAPVRDILPEILRNTIAMISQEVHVFSGTLADDLRLAHPEATDEELVQALERVNAESWATNLLHTQVGTGAHRLTATQSQQLALARLILADPEIVILDEATAEAGSAGARIVERSASAALEGRTALIVAHRLTQAATADRIIVLDNGTITESGTHEELLARGGHYAQLWTAWSTARR